MERPMRQSSMNSSTSTASAPTMLVVISGSRWARVVSMESTRSTMMFLYEPEERSSTVPSGSVASLSSSRRRVLASTWNVAWWEREVDTLCST